MPKFVCHSHVIFNNIQFKLIPAENFSLFVVNMPFFGTHQFTVFPVEMANLSYIRHFWNICIMKNTLTFTFTFNIRIATNTLTFTAGKSINWIQFLLVPAVNVNVFVIKRIFEAYILVFKLNSFYQQKMCLRWT